MILDLHGQAFHAGIERRTFGNGPREEHAIESEPEIVMKMGRTVFLDYV